MNVQFPVLLVLALSSALLLTPFSPIAHAQTGGNRAPELVGIGDQGVDENAVLKITLRASDPDRDVITFGASGLQSWMQLEGNRFIANPPFGSAGRYDLHFSASDGELTDSEPVSITVASVNTPPIFEPTLGLTVLEGETAVREINVSDAQGDPIVVAPSGLLSWMSFNGNTLAASPEFDSAGSYEVTFTASDGEASSSQSVLLTVVNVNRLPVLGPLPDRTMAELSTLSFVVSASDPDGDSVQVQAGGLPGWMSFDGTTFSASPTSTHAGSYEIEFRAGDDQGQASQTMTLTVVNQNQPPTFGAMPDRSVAEGGSKSFPITATDPDGDAVTVAVAGGLPSWMSFDGATLSVNPGFEDAGTYEIAFRVDDGAANDNSTLQLTVTNVNQPPQVSVPSDRSVDEDDSLAVTVTATDPDSDPVSISAMGLRSWMSFDGATFTATPDFTHAGSYIVTFVASDGDDTSAAQISLNVNDINRQPLFTGLLDRATSEDRTLVVDVKATDPDGDPVTVTALAGLTPWMSFDGDTLTATPGFEDAGTYGVSFSASDGVDSVQVLWQLTVDNTNRPPVLNLPASLSVAETQSESFVVTTTDPDGDAVTVTAVAGLGSWMSFDGATFTASPDFDSAGTRTVTFAASDGQTTTKGQMDVVVGNVNRAPTLATSGKLTTREDGILSVNVRGNDPDGDAVTVTAIAGLAPWMTFDGVALGGTPDFDSAGTYPITFAGHDGADTVTVDFTVTVTDVNRPPVLSVPAQHVIDEANNSQIIVTATDPDGDVVTVNAQGLSPWMSFDGATLTLAPDFDAAGSYTIALSARDGSLTTTAQIDIDVLDTNRAPQIELVADQVASEGRVLTFSVQADDLDGDPVTLSATGLTDGMSFDGSRFLAVLPAGSAGNYTITFIADDGSASDSEAVTLTVRPESTDFPPPWTQYVGSHYNSSNSSDWSWTIRGVGKNFTGLDLLNDPSLTEQLFESVAAVISTHDVIVPVPAFQVYGMDEFLTLIHDGGVQDWKDVIIAQVDTLALLDPEHRHIKFQFGNEISSLTKNEAMRMWATARGITIPGEPIASDEESIPYYAEYLLAPSVEALREASQTHYGSYDAISVMLGSIGDASTTESRSWLNSLLNYRFDGTFAPSLQGIQVHEIVDIVTVHYAGSTSNLDEIWSIWGGVSDIDALWTTEEVGARSAEAGEGAGRALSVIASHLSWYYKTGLTPEQSRVAIWGAWAEGIDDSGNSIPGTSAVVSLETLLDYFGHARLEALDESLMSVNTSHPDDVNHHGFRSLDDPRRRAISAHVPKSADGNDVDIHGVTIERLDWTGEAFTATVHVFTDQGHSIVPSTVTTGAGGISVTFPSASGLNARAAVLVLLESLD